jgi:hypothetical protein
MEHRIINNIILTIQITKLKAEELQDINKSMLQIISLPIILKALEELGSINT